MLEDPAFAKAMVENNPDLVKKLMLDDPKFADQFGAKYPDLTKKMMMDDPEFAKALAKNNPGLIKKLMLDDPAFAKWMTKNMPETVKALMANDPDFAKAMLDKNPDLRATVGPPPPTARESAEDKARLAREAQLEAQRQAQLAELQQKQLDQLVNAMDSQSKQMFQAWNEFSTQQFVEGEWGKKHQGDEGEEGVATVGPNGEVVPGGRTAAAPAALVKAGTVAYGVLDTAVNSDEPGPILATITDGPLKGSRLVGSMAPTTPPVGGFPEKVVLNFALMNVPSKPTSIGIQAVAIDPDTARTALASDVDHHYLIRYGTLFASAFLTGYAKVITSMGTTQTTAANGLSTTTITPQLSTRQQIFAALGQVGQVWAQAVAPYANLPPTVTVDSGSCLGILFLQDVSG
jgi:intracellular multiplication protein IcmE